MGLGSAIKDGFSSAGDAIGDAASSAWDAVESGAETVWEGAKDAGQGVVDIHKEALGGISDAHDWAANQMGYPDWQSAALQGGVGFLQGGPAGAAISLGMGSQHNPMMQDGGQQSGPAATFGSAGSQPLMQGSAGNFDFGMQQGGVPQGGQQSGGSSADLFTAPGAQYGTAGNQSTQLLQSNPNAFQFRPLLTGRSDVVSDLA